jgi:methionine aminotransferase
MQADFNQYPMMSGAPVLRQAIVAKIAALYGHQYDVDSEITVTAGATQALTTAILCCVHPGDEVIVIEPTYDSYVPAITLAGGVPVLVQMETGASGYSVPWAKVAAAVTPRTRLIIINTPHNPTGSVLRASDLQALADIVRGTDILLLSDEVYEHMVYDGARHESGQPLPGAGGARLRRFQLRQDLPRHGLESGLRGGAGRLMAEFRKVHQYNVFSVNTPCSTA